MSYNWNDDERGTQRLSKKRSYECLIDMKPSEYVPVTAVLKEMYDEDKEKLYTLRYCAAPITRFNDPQLQEKEDAPEEDNEELCEPLEDEANTTEVEDTESDVVNDKILDDQIYKKSMYS